MSKNKLNYAFIIITLALSLIGCATTKAPSGWLPDSNEEIDKRAYGSWIYIELNKDNRFDTNKKDNLLDESDIYYDEFSGEFVAIDSNSIYILSNLECKSFNFKNILYAHLQTRTNSKYLMAGWSVLGALSTISHGFFLILTGPLWIISGIGTTINESYEDVYTKNYPTEDWWIQFSRYARFPQGLPKSVDIKKLSGKTK